MREVEEYRWLGNFWTAVICAVAQHTWWVLTLFDGDLALRDGLAHALIRASLVGREDIKYRFIRAWMGEVVPESVPAGASLLWVGRCKATAASRLSIFANCLEGNAFGKFLDFENGQTGNSIRYGDRMFSRRAVFEPDGRYRRCDRDYGVLLLREAQVGGAERQLVAIAGLGSLGTLGLALILTSDKHRAALLEQVRQLAPYSIFHRPQDFAEICVRIELDGEQQLANLLNELDRDDGTLPFHYQVAAVVVATTKKEPAVFIWKVALELRPDADPCLGGSVRAGDAGPWVHLSPKRFKLLDILVNSPERATRETLWKELDFPGSGPPPRGGSDPLSQRVHNLKDDLTDKVLQGRVERAPIRFDRKEKRYVLDLD